MIPSISTALNAIVGRATTLANASGAGRAFELFVMTEVALGLRNSGFSVWLQRSDGTTIRAADSNRRFIQRGGAPTGVAQASSGPNNASAIGFRWRHRPGWEIWNGIQFYGRSQATHEIDIAIVPESVGADLRISGGSPVGRPRVAIECKDVGTDGSLDEMRTLVARLYDVTLLHAHHRHLPYYSAQAIHPGTPASSKDRAVVTYWQENRRTKNILARRTGFVGGTIPLASYHHIESHANITVGSPAVTELVDSVVEWALRNAR
jgi:hypothetical protein